MTSKRKVEIFSAGCSACDETIQMANRIACPSCEISVLDMKNPAVATRARSLGIHSVPAVLIDGKLAGCCSDRGPSEDELRKGGIGKPKD